jgi:hypothetical protein
MNIERERGLAHGEGRWLHKLAHAGRGMRRDGGGGRRKG